MPIRHATLHQLKIFHALAQHLSVKRTAEVMHLTPPAVSIQVRQLADFCGQPLIEQVGKRIYLTDAGKAVASACQDLFDRLERLEQEIAMLQGLEHGRLRVAAITTAQYFVPELLGRFCVQHANLEVSLFIGNREQLFERIRNNEDDLYILGRPPKGVAIESEIFAENPLVVVAPANHPLADRKAIDPRALSTEPFILREEGSGTRQSTLDFFDKHKIELKIRMELGSNEAIKRCVIAGLGISVLSLTNLEQDIANGSLVELDVRGFPLKRHWHVVHLRDKVLSPAAQAFYRFITSKSDDFALSGSAS
ncbi:MAG: LysR family transcriptional regulator [Gammaproteobacteria bacterium]